MHSHTCMHTYIHMPETEKERARERFQGSDHKQTRRLADLNDLFNRILIFLFVCCESLLGLGLLVVFLPRGRKTILKFGHYSGMN